MHQINNLIAGLMLVIVFVSPQSTSAQTNPTTPGWHEEQTIDVNGVTRYYRYLVPQQLANPAAVVLLLHGGGSNMRQITAPSNGSGNQWPLIAEQAGFLLLIPNGTQISTNDAASNQQTWNDCRIAEVGSTADDVAFIDQLLGWASNVFSVDEQRIYSTGASNGGMMTYRLLEELPHRIAAGAAFIANQPSPSECIPLNLPRSVMIANGSADLLVLEAGGPVATDSGRRGFSLSAADTIAYWQNNNQTWQIAAEQFTFPDLNTNDSSTVESSRYRGGNNGTEIRFDRIIGGGHSVPSIAFPIRPSSALLLGPQNRDIEGNVEAWTFLSRQRRDGRSDQILTPAALTGAWFDLALDGEGLVLVSTPAGLGGFYFGNDTSSQRLWLLSGLHVDELVWGQTINLSLSQSAEGNFTQPAPPALSQNWGEITLQFNNCNSLTGTLSGIDGSKIMNLVPLVTVRGQTCIPPGGESDN